MQYILQHTIFITLLCLFPYFFSNFLLYCTVNRNGAICSKHVTIGTNRASKEPLTHGSISISKGLTGWWPPVWKRGDSGQQRRCSHQVRLCSGTSFANWKGQTGFLSVRPEWACCGTWRRSGAAWSPRWTRSWTGRPPHSRGWRRSDLQT